MHNIKFEEIYSEYTRNSEEFIKSSRLQNGSYCLPSISKANVWFRFGQANPSNRQIFDSPLVLQLIEMLKWYVDTDETNECDPENEYWIKGKLKAQGLLKQIEEEVK